MDRVTNPPYLVNQPSDTLMMQSVYLATEEHVEVFISIHSLKMNSITKMFRLEAHHDLLSKSEWKITKSFCFRKCRLPATLKLTEKKSLDIFLPQSCYFQKEFATARVCVCVWEREREREREENCLSSIHSNRDSFFSVSKWDHSMIVILWDPPRFFW